MRAMTKKMTRRFAWVLGGLLLAAQLPAHATVEYVHTDSLGTPVAITDSDGNVIQASEYEPFGKLLNRPLTDAPGYTGHETDATTGMVYAQQRYYDPQIGRFLSADPVTPETGGNFNRYEYAANNPYMFKDPDGRADTQSQPTQQEAQDKQDKQRGLSGSISDFHPGTGKEAGIDGALPGSNYNTTNRGESSGVASKSESGQPGILSKAGSAARTLLDAASNAASAANEALPKRPGHWVAGLNAAVTKWVPPSGRALGRLSSFLGALEIIKGGYDFGHAALNRDGVGMFAAGTDVAWGVAGYFPVTAPGSIAYGQTSFFMEHSTAGQSLASSLADSMCRASSNC